MSNTLANGGSGTVQVNVRPLIKTCPEEAGIGELTLDDGTQLVVIGNTFFPSQDRGALAIVHKLLQHKRSLVEAGELKDIVVILMGNILHGEAFKQVTGKDRTNKLVAKTAIAELTKVRAENESPEERWNALAQLGGDFIAEFAESSGGHVYYIPAVGMRTEVELFAYILEQKERIDNNAARHPEEAVTGPDIAEDFAEFLGLHNNENVTVMPFGAALRINGVRFWCGDFKRRQPVTAAITDVEQHHESVWRTGDGKIGAGYWTTPIHSFGESLRKWWQAVEIGKMYDLTLQLGYQRNYDRRGTGFGFATIAGGTIHGAPVTLLRGDSGLRSVVVDGVPYIEDEPGGQFNVIPMKHPVRAAAATAKKAVAPAKRAPRKAATPVKATDAAATPNRRAKRGTTGSTNKPKQ